MGDAVFRRLYFGRQLRVDWYVFWDGWSLVSRFSRDLREFNRALDRMSKVSLVSLPCTLFVVFTVLV